MEETLRDAGEGFWSGRPDEEAGQSADELLIPPTTITSGRKRKVFIL